MVWDFRFWLREVTPPQSPLIRGEVFGSPPDKGELEGVKLFIGKIFKETIPQDLFPMCISA
jgi:hypothetical protein